MLAVRLSVLTWLTLATGSLRAELLAEECFDYPANSPVAGCKGGRGWDGAWFASPRNGRDNQIVGPSMTFADLANHGNRMRQIGSDVRSFRRLDTRRKEVASWVVEGEHGLAYGKDGTTIWIAFLLAMTSHPKSAYGGVHLCDGLGDLKADPFGDKQKHQRISLGRSNTSKGWYLGRVTNGAPGAGKWDSGLAMDERPHFLVYRFDFKPGADEAWLFIDPKPGREPEARTAAVHATGISAFRFNTLSVGAGAGAEFHLDALRIGTTFADVAPVAKVPPPK